MRRIQLSEKLSYFELEDEVGVFCLMPGPKHPKPRFIAVEDRQSFRCYYNHLRAIEDKQFSLASITAASSSEFLDELPPL